MQMISTIGKPGIYSWALAATSAIPASQPQAQPKMQPVTKEQLATLRKCILDKILLFSGRGTRNKYGAAYVQLIIILLSIATPILIGWKPDEEATRKLFINAALASSALTAGTNMLYNFFDYKELWVHYKVARNELEIVLAELNYLESLGLENITQPQMAGLFKRYVQVCADTNSFYRQTRLAKDDVNASKRA